MALDELACGCSLIEGCPTGRRLFAMRHWYKLSKHLESSYLRTRRERRAAEAREARRRARAEKIAAALLKVRGEVLAHVRRAERLRETEKKTA